jgi:hypothetical protein
MLAARILGNAIDVTMHVGSRNRLRSHEKLERLDLISSN